MSAKYDQLNSLSEDTFRKEVLVPLLRKMGYENVRLTHGSKEYGKDVTYCEQGKLNSIFYAVVAKVGNISGSASRGDILTIKDQISQCFNVPVEDITNNTSSEIFINHVVVWTTGKISENAQKRIVKEIKSDFKNNITFIDGNKTLELLEKHYPAFFSIGDATVSIYYENAKTKYGRLEELYTIGGSSAQKHLPTMFVAPTIEHLPKVRSKQAKQEKLPYKSYLFSHLIDERSNVLLLGEMGSGKSTILRRLLTEVIETNEQELRKYPIPVFIRYKKIQLNQKDPIVDIIYKEYQDLSESIPSDDVSDMLTEGKFLVLLDGLDELDTSQDIYSALDITTAFIKRFPKTRVIVASRMLEMFKANTFLDYFSVYRLMDFSPEQVKELIMKWFGSDDLNGKQLIRLISEPMTATTLPFTPLTLTLVAILYQSGFTELPANLTELFEKYTELSLGRWDMSKDISTQIEWKKKQLVMRKISWHMMYNYFNTIEPNEVKEAIHRMETERGLAVDIDLFYREMVERSGLLISNMDGRLEFKHRAFMDYFAGGELNNRTDAVQFVIDKFPSPRWSRTIFFACGLKPEGEGEKYIRAIIEKVDKSSCQLFHYAMQLGLLAQATYLARQETKVDAVRKSLFAFTEAWDEFAINFNDAYNEGKVKNPINHWLLLYIFSGTVIFTIGSTTLSGALAQLSNEIKVAHEATSSSNSTELERRRNEWITYFLAIASIRANNVHDFVEFFSAKHIIDPAFIQIGIYEAETLIEDEVASKQDKEALKELIKDLRKKLKGNGDYLSKLSNQRPILIDGSYDNRHKAENLLH